MIASSLPSNPPVPPLFPHDSVRGGATVTPCTWFDSSAAEAISVGIVSSSSVAP